MAFISLTRLRLRSLRLLPAFAVHNWRTTRQVRRAAGLVAGQFATEGVSVFWTMTAWTDAAAMRAYMSSGAHLAAMPKLLDWCDEASVAHWDQPGVELPSPADALAAMVEHGRTSKVRHPSPGHAAGRVAPGRRVPRAGPQLKLRA